jgi:hypothetical protein
MRQRLAKTFCPRLGRPARWLLVLVGTSVGAGADDWHTYSNARYGFSLQYPSNVFAVERTAEAGDGQLFVAKNGDARLLVGTLSNEANFTPASYQSYVARNSYADYRIGYHRLGGSWFALSGEGNGKIFYEKAMFSCGGQRINSFAMIYRSAKTQNRRAKKKALSIGPGCQAVVGGSPCRLLAQTAAHPQ